MDIPRKASASDRLPRMRIWLDGAPQIAVVEYDMDEGWVDRCIKDERGLITFDDSGNAITERKHGTVTAEWM